MQQKLIWFFCLSAIAMSGSAQQFISKGRIEFERKTNQHAFLDENNSWDAQAKKSLPKFVTYYFNLDFDNDKLLYKAGRDADVKQNKYWGVFDGDNTIATNLSTNTAITQKSVYSDTYLITDSVRKIDWKISTEIRKIAGFDCRKAVGKVMDSIIVIAFYTDEILPNGGPESFAGLPGMILGVAVPKMHTTWYATKLELAPINDAQLASPTRGKKIAAGEFKKQLKDILKNWGDEGKRMEWQLLL